MSAYFKVITERNKLSLNKPQDLDIVYYSELNEWETGNAFRSFSVKCVLDETIHYRIGKQEYPVRKGQYLVSLKQPDVKAYFDCGRKVKSICIDICPTTLSEVFTLLTHKSDPRLDDYITNHFKYPEFYESVLHMHDSPAGQFLQGLGKQIQFERRETEVTKDWIYGLTERIILQEYGRFVTISNINSCKPSTRKEIYRRMREGKDYIDEHLLTIGSINEAALACNMSEYHFLRCFRQVHGLTPYKYILRSRLQLACELLMQKEKTLTAIASSTGFPDLFTFSKAFKKQYGRSPSAYASNLQHPTSNI